MRRSNQPLPLKGRFIGDTRVCGLRTPPDPRNPMYFPSGIKVRADDPAAEWWELRQWDEDDDSPRDAGLDWVLTEEGHRRFPSRAEADVVAAKLCEENRPAPSRSDD